ncbi:hypothetical protein HAZT_HAZT008392 [Hyalella azteca]|uniref:Uncharacterized protein n=1 Tax=Hyalella azteca TaxID=294128 RepID=A0A6A0H6G9_HYAAZ|nr:hypothetical protein HAZT_HAZT008392 [Hyalella azteca]
MAPEFQRFVAATQFWTANARRAFPCFDEPSLKATFDITLGRQQHMTAIANTPIRETSPIPNQPGWFFDKFERTEKMSTYLLAFVISEFSNITIENKARVRVFARDDILERSSHAISVGDRSINFFEQYLNSSLAVPKIDMVGLPLTAHHGMENWGLVTFRESSLSYSSEDSTASGLLLSTELVVHEMAHQWFGNLVTFEWWTDLWLSEGFATYMAAVAIQELFPAWKSMDYFCASRLRSVMVDDSSLASHPVRTHVADPNDINEVFDAIPYSKGN